MGCTRDKQFRNGLLGLPWIKTLRAIPFPVEKWMRTQRTSPKSTADLPSEFDLSFDAGYTLRQCRVAWQTLTNLGVSF